DLLQHFHRRTLDGDLNVVKEIVSGAVAVLSKGVAPPVLGGVPPVAADVEPAAKSDDPVGHDDLLVVTPPGRMDAVEIKMDLLRPLMKAVPLPPLPLGGEDDRVVPGEDVNLQLRPLGGDPLQQREKCHRVVGRFGLLPTQQRDAAVELPSGKEERFLGFEDRLVNGFVKEGGVDDDVDPVSGGDSVAVLLVEEFFGAHLLASTSAAPPGDNGRTLSGTVRFSSQTR